MIDRDVFNEQMGILGDRHRHVLSPVTLNTYYDLLSGRMTTAQLVAAVNRHLMTPGAFFPGPGDLIPPLQERKTVAELEAQARAEGLNAPAQKPALTSGQPRLPRGGKTQRVGEIVARVEPKREGAA